MLTIPIIVTLIDKDNNGKLSQLHGNQAYNWVMTNLRVTGADLESVMRGPDAHVSFQTPRYKIHIEVDGD